MRIAYFTAGTTGAGHLVRGLALQRALARARFRGELRIFGPPLPFPATARIDYQHTRSDPAELRDPRRALASPIARALLAFAPDLLLVDLFWAPLYHILPQLRLCPAWLLLRICPPAWLRGPANTPFRTSHFERIIAIEPLPYTEISDTIDPVLLSDPEECWSGEALRAELGLSAATRITAVAHAGKPGERGQLEEQAQRTSHQGPPHHLQSYDLSRPDAPFPVAPRLAAADRIYLGAGYNSFWEAHRLGYAERTHFHPFPRRIDDQHYRLRHLRGARPATNGADTLARWLLDRATSALSRRSPP
jgi:hypothetical protein